MWRTSLKTKKWKKNRHRVDVFCRSTHLSRMSLHYSFLISWRFHYCCWFVPLRVTRLHLSILKMDNLTSDGKLTFVLSFSQTHWNCCIHGNFLSSFEHHDLQVFDCTREKFSFMYANREKNMNILKISLLNVWMELFFNTKTLLDLGVDSEHYQVIPQTPKELHRN